MKNEKLMALLEEIEEKVEEIRNSEDDIREKLADPKDMEEYIRNLDNLSSIVAELKTWFS